MKTFDGKNPMIKNSFKRSSVMVEGTQLQMVGAFNNMMFKDELKRKATCRFNSMMKLIVK